MTFVQAEDSVQTWERVRRMAVRTRIGTDHVMASAAIPMFFPACDIDGQYFGDGSLRQSHPLAPAIHLGADRILAISSRWRPATPTDDRNDRSLSTCGSTDRPSPEFHLPG